MSYGVALTPGYRRNFGNFQPLSRFQIALAPKPILDRRLKPVKRHTVAGLEQPVGSR